MRLFALFVALSLHGLQNPEIMTGDFFVEKAGNCVNISQKTDKGILHWENFSIQRDKKVHFELPSKKSAVLNRVKGSSVSEISGKLTSNGKVFLQNPNGILIGEHGVIQTAGFLATTLALSDQDFIKGKEMRFQGMSSKKLVHLGKIAAKDVFLIAKEIENMGEIHGENVFLAAGGSLLFSERENVFYRLDENALQGAAINQQGIIDAGTMKKENGRVFLFADEGEISVEGKIRAEKGVISLLGKKIFLKNFSEISALKLVAGKTESAQFFARALMVETEAKVSLDAGLEGDGGNALFYAEDFLDFRGTVSARGGERFGKGGFIEISSPRNLRFLGKIDTKASMGAMGELYIDPSDIIIDHFSGMSMPAFTGSMYDPKAAVALLDISQLENTLSTSNVTVSTSLGTGGEGKIFVQNSLSWDAPTKLTLDADKQVIFKTDVSLSNTHSGSGSWTAFDMKANKNAETLGNFHAIDLERSVQITSVEGDIFLEGKGGNVGNCNFGVSLNEKSVIASTGTGQDAANIHISGDAGSGDSMEIGVFLLGGRLSTLDGDIDILGTSQGEGTYNIGVDLYHGAEISSANTGEIRINGQGISGIDECHGVSMRFHSEISSLYGDISIEGTSLAKTDHNSGITVGLSSAIRSLGSGPEAAKITLSGESGYGYSEGYGISLEGASEIHSIDGDVSLHGVSNGTEDYNIGVLLMDESEILSIGEGEDAANITIIGVGGTGKVQNVGVLFEEGSDAKAKKGKVIIEGG